MWTEALQACQLLPPLSANPPVKFDRSNGFVTGLMNALKNEPESGGELRQASRPRVHSVDVRRTEIKRDLPLNNYQSATLMVTENAIEGKVMRTVAVLNDRLFKGLSKDYFEMRHYVLDKSTLTMYIKNENDLSLRLYDPDNHIVEVDENLSNQFVINYKSFFKQKLRTDIVTPVEFPFPLVVRLQKN